MGQICCQLPVTADLVSLRYLISLNSGAIAETITQNNVTDVEFSVSFILKINAVV